MRELRTGAKNPKAGAFGAVDTRRFDEAGATAGVFTSVSARGMMVYIR